MFIRLHFLCLFLFSVLITIGQQSSNIVSGIAVNVNNNTQFLREGYVELYKIQPVGQPYDLIAVDTINHSGYFEFQNIESGEFLLRAVPIGNDREKYGSSFYNEELEWFNADTVYLTDGENLNLTFGIFELIKLPECDGLFSFPLKYNCNANPRCSDENLEIIIERRRADGGRMDSYEVFYFSSLYPDELISICLPSGTYRIKPRLLSEPFPQNDDNSIVEIEIPEYQAFQFEVSIDFTEMNITVNFNKILNLENKNYPIVFPNPTEGILFVDNNRLKEIGIYNLQGKLIKATISKNQIDLSEYPSGLYLLKVDEKVYKVWKE